MAGGRVYAFGEPENDGERRVIRYLDENLPSPYRIYHSLERQGNGQTYEWDVLVLAPHALYCIEVKDWPGRVVGNDREWMLNNGAIRPNPYPLIAKKARILKSRLVERSAFLSGVWTEPLVVIADDRAHLVLSGDCAAHTVTLKDVVARLRDIKAVPQVRFNHLQQQAQIEKILTDDFRPALGKHEIMQFRLLEQVSATDLFTEWRAENRFADAAPVLLKIYAPDPYLPTEQRTEQLRLVRRDFEAAARMGNHPHIRAARDFFPIDGNRYVLVLDDLTGGTLAAELLAGHSLTFERKLRLVEDIASGLAHAHSCKVVHRNICPPNIVLTPVGAVLTNFDCARVENTHTVHELVDPDLDPNYLAPEVCGSSVAATTASDVYALGVIFYQLLTGHLPSEKGEFIALSSIDPLVDPSFDDLVARMIAPEPALRPPSAEVYETLVTLRNQQYSATRAPKKDDVDSQATAIDYAIGDTIDGQYLVREDLGEGSAGRVYRVYSAVTDREYAMKVFRDAGLGLEDAQKEFAALVKLSHPRIARVWHAGLLRQGAYFLLRDYIPGRSLRSLQQSQQPGAGEAVTIIRDLLQALAYLHSQHYVHRDIKPSNVLVSTGGAWLIDFNIAIAANDVGDEAGTPLYAPPDLATCASQPSRDLFAAGVMLYELLTGQHPYNGAPRPGMAPREPSSILLRLSAPMAEVLRRAVAPSATDRYTAAEDFLADLESIDEPLVAQSSEYKLAGGITITLQERERPNYNPYLTRFLTLYSQNRIDNSGTRGYDEVSRATYVRTRLDKRLAPDLLAGKLRLVIITGNAGDGKTAFLQSLEEQVAHGGNGREPVPVTPLHSGNGATFVLHGLTYQTNYDGSQNEADLQNDDALESFFAPFAGPVEAIDAQSQGLVRLIAINEGKLRDFLDRRRERFPWLTEAVDAYLEHGAPLPNGYLLVNLNDRSVITQPASILNQQIQVLCDPAFWEPCLGCVYRDRCPVKFNVDTINHPEVGPRVRQRMEHLFGIAHLRGRMHLTMRGVRSALAYTLFGEDDCSAIVARLDAANQPDGDEQLLRRFYYNALSEVRPIRQDPQETAAESDRLMRLLAEADVGLGATPVEDRSLYFEGPRALALLPPTASRSDYDRDLLQAIMERLTAVEDHGEARSERLRLHAALRRKAFFERPDDGWEAMLPYKTLDIVLRALTGDEGALADLKAQIVRGINSGEGLGNVDDALVLRLARGVPGRIRSFRQFPIADFVLRPASIAGSHDYVEFAPSSLELTYLPSSNGHAASRPTLHLNLDLLELLTRMARGYAPTTAEWRGPLVNLLVFRTLLAHELYHQLILVDAREDRRFLVHKQEGQLSLTLEEPGHAAV